MKSTVLSLFALLLVSTLAIAQPEETSTPKTDGPQISFEETEYDFGDIRQGDVVEHSFEFTNTGNAPLILNNVLTTCGCTAPEWPKNPILPGEKGEIKVRFNSTGKMGRQNKVITVRSNVEGTDSRIKIISMVLPKEKEEAGN